MEKDSTDTKNEVSWFHCTEVSWFHCTASFLAGAGLAITIYKTFFESPKRLARRLVNRKKIEKDQTLNQILNKSKNPVRIWIDGCFDLMHFGHANAFRQSRALGDYLIVGLNSDEEIIKIKGPPIMTQEERYIAVKACRFVDEIVNDSPYTMNREYLEMVFDKYKVDYVVHGDDPCLLPDGTDVFQEAKDMGRYKQIKRTEGVSTTEIVGRMLTMSRGHHTPRTSARENESSDQMRRKTSVNYSPNSHFIRHSNFLPTGRRIKQFGANKKPKPGDTIIYIDGAWDLFHAGHIEILEKAKMFGDFLLVGIHTDDFVNKQKGSNYPILNLHERALSVMSCRYVDEVIIGAPAQITQQVLTTFNIAVVCTGDFTTTQLLHRYEVPRTKGILKETTADRKLTTETIVTRIFQRREAFELKFKKKRAQEKKYEENQEYVPDLS